MKKVLYLLEVITMTLISVGCGERNSTDYEEQLQLMAGNEDIIKCGKYIESLYGSFAVTDLDRNGRLEIIFSHTEGSGLYTYNEYYEVNGTYDGMTKYEDGSVWTNDEAQILWYDEVDTYFDDEKKIYYYIFNKYTRDGSWLYYADCRALFLKDGIISSIPLAFKEGEDQNNDSEWIETYWGTDRKSIITKEEYDNAAEIYFEGYTKEKVKIGWNDCKVGEIFCGTTEEILEALKKSLNDSSFVVTKIG